MDGITRGGGGGVAVVDDITRGGGGGVAVVDDDLGVDGMQCSDHPYGNKTPAGGICAFCLQEKLGKLVSSSSSFFIGSSSSSPSFRSDAGAKRASVSSTARSLSLSTSHENGGSHFQDGYYSRRAPIPFLLTQKKNRKPAVSIDQSTNLSLIRSKSTTTPRRGRYLASEVEDYRLQKRGFWSFLSLSKHAGTRKSSRDVKLATASTSACQSLPRRPAAASAASASSGTEHVPADVAESPNISGSSAASFGRKVSRSRSVGCGSRSFSGDFFERISTGFGDCTLRRVESQREGKSVAAVHGGAGGGDAIKETVRCGGIFSGFMMTSSSSSSSSSTYWMSSSTEDGKGSAATPLAYGRSRSWGWAFASPMRAFNKPSSSSSKDGKTSKNAKTTTNLAAIPSLLAVSG